MQIVDQHYNDAYQFSYYQGEVYFSTGTRIWEDSIPEPKFNPITIKINTNIGRIEGSISVPDTIKTITIDAPDTIALNTQLTISWSGSNADYYCVSYYHNWMEMEYIRLGYSRDTLIQGNSLQIDGSKLSKDGDISDFEITPINGPFPTKNAKANMTGHGFGFLYLQNSAISSNKTIVIGKGINYALFEEFKSTKSTEKDSSKRVFGKIESSLH